jgi:hypothetical protein
VAKAKWFRRTARPSHRGTKIVRIASKVPKLVAADVPKLDLSKLRKPTVPETSVGTKPGKEVILKRRASLKLRRQRKPQNTKAQDAPITDLRRPKGCTKVLWDAVLRRLGLFVGIHVAPDGRVVPGLEFLQVADAETELKTAANTLSLVAALKLYDTLAVRLLFSGTDALWKAAACADVKRGGIVNFPANTDGAVLKDLVSALAKEGEFEAACMIVRGCPASQMAQLMHMVLEGVMAKHDQEAVGRFMEGIEYAGMRLIRNHEQFVDLMRKCSKEMKQLLIGAMLARYNVALARAEKKEIDWDHAAELCRVTCALLEVGDVEAASMFIRRENLHPGIRAEILRILAADVAEGKTSLATIVRMKYQLGEQQQDAWADSLRKIRLEAPSTAVKS